MGGNIGNSLLEADKVDLAKQLIEKARQKGINLMLPQDSVMRMHSKMKHKPNR
jgi:phosphoglycerate kinase